MLPMMKVSEFVLIRVGQAWGKGEKEASLFKKLSEW